MVKWGIIGAGNIAKRFATSLKNEKDAMLYAISGRSIEKLNAFQKEFPCEKVYVGYEQLLQDKEVDVVYIALPHHMHKEWSIKALESHKAVLCEKPAVLNEAEMMEIAEAAKCNHTLYMEAMKSRFEPAYIKTKCLLEEGVIGEIQSVYAENCFVFPQEMVGKTYHTQSGAGSGCLLDVGCYCVNWLGDLLEGDPTIQEIHANVKDSVAYYVDAKLKFGKCEGEIVCAFDRKTKSYATIIGDKGKMVIENAHRPNAIHLYTEGMEKIIDLPYQYDDFYGQIHHFNELVKDNKKESEIMPLSASIRNASILDFIKMNMMGNGK